MVSLFTEFSGIRANLAIQLVEGVREARLGSLIRDLAYRVFRITTGRVIVINHCILTFELR